jgi:hypothetical protein
MADVFISYCSEDREQVRTLVSALRAEGLDAWWDQDIPVGGDWADSVAAALEQAKAVVACWSPASVASANVREEARRARTRGLLVQTYIRECEAPLFFGEQQGARLVGWNGSRDSDRFQMLCKGLRALIAGERPPSALGRQIGYKKRSNVIFPMLLAAFAILVAAGTAILFIPEVRERVLPQPPVSYTMRSGETAVFRPAQVPQASDRFRAPARLTLKPEFIPDTETTAAPHIASLGVSMEIPGAAPIQFMWLSFIDKDVGTATHISGPMYLGVTFERAVTFEPVSSLQWSQFVSTLDTAYRARQQYLVLRMEATLTPKAGGARLTNVCRLPIAPLLEQIRLGGADIDAIFAQCGSLAPPLPP